MEMMELESATDRRQPAVPAYHVLEDLYFLNGVKGFFVFLCFFIAYFSLNTLRLDWWHGHQTIKWLTEAREDMDIVKFRDAQTHEALRQLPFITTFHGCSALSHAGRPAWIRLSSSAR